jgi:membrane protein DedA with SNARE-associated domain
MRIMRKRDYFRLEVLGTLLQPILLIVITYFFVAQGWVHNSDVLWEVVMITTVASLLSLGIAWVLEGGKKR